MNASIIHFIIFNASCGMKTCDGATFEQLLVAMVEPLLPTVLTKLWSDFTSESHSPPGLADLLKFLKRRSQAIEAIVPPKPSSTSQVPTRAIPTSRSSPYPQSFACSRT